MMAVQLNYLIDLNDNTHLHAAVYITYWLEMQWEVDWVLMSVLELDFASGCQLDLMLVRRSERL